MRLFFGVRRSLFQVIDAKIKKLYSLYIVEDDNDMEEKDK